MVNNVEPTAEQKALKVWVMSSAKPNPNRGNGLHDWYCDTFHQRDKYPPRLATQSELDTLHPCGKCGGNKPGDRFPSNLGATCPIHFLVLLPSGGCDECNQQ